MMDGRKILISSEEYENIRKILNNGENGFIELRSGEYINTKSVSSITIPEVEPYFWGNKMNKSMTSVLVGGEWKNFGGSRKAIEYRLKNAPDVKIPESLVKKLTIERTKDIIGSEIHLLELGENY